MAQDSNTRRVSKTAVASLADSFSAELSVLRPLPTVASGIVQFENWELYGARRQSKSDLDHPNHSWFNKRPNFERISCQKPIVANNFKGPKMWTHLRGSVQTDKAWICSKMATNRSKHYSLGILPLKSGPFPSSASSVYCNVHRQRKNVECHFASTTFDQMGKHCRAIITLSRV